MISPRYSQFGKLYWRDAVAILFALVVTVYIGWHWSGMGRHPDAPIIYAGDGLQYSYLIEQSGAPGGLGDIRNAGAPFGTQHLDFPNSDAGNLLLARMSAPDGNIAHRYNRFYLLGFVLTVLAGYGVARYAGLRRSWALGVTLAFALLPFHFGRIGHLFYTNYSAAALAFFVALAVGRPEPLDRRRRWALRAAIVAACIWCGATGVYYALFSCIVLGCAALALLARERRWRAAIAPAVAIAIIVMTVAFQLAPSMEFHREFGRNREVAERNFRESEVYGVKIVQMVIPSQFTHFHAFGKVRKEYDTNAPLVNENGTASLGLLGAFGLLISIGLVAMSGWRDRLDWPVALAAMLVVMLTIVATVGGISTLFAMWVTPQIRAWNRISPFIGFYALIVAAGVLQSWFRRPRAGAVVACAIILIVIADDRPRRFPGIKAIEKTSAASYESDKRFGEELASRLPAGTMVLQVPIIPYPEAGSPFGDYNQFRNNLHAPSLWWTHGAMRGRAESSWLTGLGTIPAPELIETARRVGFRAFAFDNRIHDAVVTAVATAVRAVPGVQSISSPDGQLTAFIVPPLDPAVQGGRAWAPHAGWWPVDQVADKRWSWAEGNAIVKLQRAHGQLSCRLEGVLSSPVARTVTISGDDGKVLARQRLDGHTSQTFAVDVPGNEDLLHFDTDTPATKLPGDRRLRTFQMFYRPGATCNYEGTPTGG